jgi:hypothetical protein
MKTKRGGKDKGNIIPKTVNKEQKEDPAMVPLPATFATQTTVNLPMPPTNQQEALAEDEQNSTEEFNRALANVQNHNYYYYTSRDDNSPVQRRPAQLGDHKHIGSYNTRDSRRWSREYRRQRSLARRYGGQTMNNLEPLQDLNTGINNIQQLKLNHQYIIDRHRGNLPLLEVKKQNGFRLYRERNTPNDNWSVWKSLGNYDFKNRDSGIRGFFRPHPTGVNRTLGRGGKKKKRKTKRKNKLKTKRNKKRKTKRKRKRKTKRRR